MYIKVGKRNGLLSSEYGKRNELPFPTDPVKTPCQRTKQETKPPIQTKNYKWAQVLLSQLPTKQTVKIGATLKR
jgi:hypothetical protein